MTLTPHFIPTDQPSRIWQHRDGLIIDQWQGAMYAQQLLLTSNEPPKIGERYNYDGILLTRSGYKDSDYTKEKTIIAAYPPIQGIPNITDEDIAYIVANPESKVECATELAIRRTREPMDVGGHSVVTQTVEVPVILDGFIQLLRPTSRKIEIEFGTECPHCHETIEGVVPVQSSHPEPLFTKEDVIDFAKGIHENQNLHGHDSIESCFNEWLTTHQQK